ncbi:MAG: putative metal-binding motif-containing protein [Myxococcales bacterium]|nr:putative metal-binding motif-containing protein [Myxococcales bacterium]
MSVTHGGAGRRLVMLAALAAAGVVPSCGGRTELLLGPQLPPAPECERDDDCPGHDDLCAPIRCLPGSVVAPFVELPAGKLLPPRVCYAPPELVVACDDNDPCTTDSCNAAFGVCSYAPSTLDIDGDGHRAPLPGEQAGTPGACGDDCNDANENAYPGHPEVCDGVDNDCNGIVDDGQDWTVVGNEVRISGDIAPASPGGLGFDGESYLAIYSGTSNGMVMYQTGLDVNGQKITPLEQPVVLQNSDSYGGPIVWIGDRYGLAWDDRRDGDYEIYFTLLGRHGEKAIPDTRLSAALGFSIYPSLGWNSKEFVVAWEDDRNGTFDVYAQRLSVDGVPLGGNVALTPIGGADDESPVIASGSSTVGLTFANGSAGYQVVRFQTYVYDTLMPQSGIVDLTDGSTESVYPTVVWNEDSYVVAWFDRTGSERAIFAAVLGEDGALLVPPTAVSHPGAFRSRYPSIKPLGDRLLFVYSDDRDQNDGYELYTHMVDRTLVSLGAERRITNGPRDSIFPVTTFGPQGNLGILFRDDRQGGEHDVWFAHLGCGLIP